MNLIPYRPPLERGVDSVSKYVLVQTIGVDFGVKQIKVPETDCVVEFFLFDCPGQGVFNKLEQVCPLSMLFSVEQNSLVCNS